MITLGEFTGLLMSDFLQARKMADACAASISEEYHVNPLLKGMPVPRYTISEAEIDVPVQIAGVQQVKVGEEEMKKLLMKIEKVLPTLLYRNIKNCYYEKQQEFGIYPDEQTPFINKNSLKKMCRIIGSTMFFEFKEIFEQQEGVLIIPETGKMEQNCTPEQVMRMKIKIREQDVDFIVNRDDETGETDRFLALS